MTVRTRDWLQFGSLVAIAFVLGLAFASSLDLPKKGGAAEPLAAAQQTTAPPRSPLPAAKPIADLSEAFVAVAEHVKPAVVFIRSEKRERASDTRLPPGFDDFFPQLRRRPQIEQGSGSGFIVSTDGYILTNNHVVAGADRVTVKLFDKREFTARVVGTDPSTDVAVIKIDTNGLPTAQFGNSDSVRIGEWVLAIGNPLGENFTFTVTAGIVSAKGRLLGGLQQSRYSIQDFIQTDAAINPGNSGGPLVNVHGEVIGINSAIASETGFYTGYGFAIPINLARTVMQQLIKSGHVERAVMGVAIRAVDPEDADLVGLKEAKGVVVNDYSPDATHSPAKDAGTRLGGGPGAKEEILGISVQPLTQEDARDPRLRPVLRDGGGLIVSEVSPDGPAYRRLLSADDDGGPDIIVAVNGKPARTRQELRDALKDVKSGDIVTLQVLDRKSTRLNSSHGYISYAVFCLKKKKNRNTKSR